MGASLRFFPLPFCVGGWWPLAPSARKFGNEIYYFIGRLRAGCALFDWFGGAGGAVAGAGRAGPIGGGLTCRGALVIGA